MVAMSGIIVINGLLSLGGLSQPDAGRYPESPSHDTDVEKDTGQVTQSFGQRQAQSMQRQQESRQQEEVSAQLSRHA
jgi:hypothetical protein